MKEDDEVEAYSKLVEKQKRSKKPLPEIPLAENVSRLNLNEASRVNAGNPVVGANIHRYAPRWARWLLGAIGVFIVVIIVLDTMFIIIRLMK